MCLITVDAKGFAGIWVFFASEQGRIVQEREQKTSEDATGIRAEIGEVQQKNLSGLHDIMQVQAVFRLGEHE